MYNLEKPGDPAKPHHNESGPLPGLIQGTPLGWANKDLGASISTASSSAGSSNRISTFYTDSWSVRKSSPYKA
jgi:hypothetical protein